MGKILREKYCNVESMSTEQPMFLAHRRCKGSRGGGAVREAGGRAARRSVGEWRRAKPYQPSRGAQVRWEWER